MPERLRPVVKAFAEEMEDCLRENDHKEGWATCEIDYLRRRLREEIVELDQALDQGGDVTREAADVANFAMMIADNYTRLIVGRQGLAEVHQLGKVHWPNEYRRG